MLKTTVKANLRATLDLLDTLCRSLSVEDSDIPQGDRELAYIILTNLESTIFVMEKQEDETAKQYLLEVAENPRLSPANVETLKQAALILSEIAQETA